MSLIINDDEVCKICGAYWCGNGFCANGHPRYGRKGRKEAKEMSRNSCMEIECEYWDGSGDKCTVPSHLCPFTKEEEKK